MTAHVGDILLALAVLFLFAGALLLALRHWISTVADLIWMTVLKPGLALSAMTAVTFVVLVLVYATRPQRAGALIALPLLIALIVTPMLARPMVNVAARRLFSRLGYAYELDAASLRLADVFLLEELQLRTLYTAPESKAATKP